MLSKARFLPYDQEKQKKLKVKSEKNGCTTIQVITGTKK